MDIERHKTPRLEKLEFDLRDNVKFSFEGESIHVYPNAEIDNFLNETNPGQFMVTPNSGGGGRGIMIWIHKSVILPFRPVILQHELTEMHLAVHNSLGTEEAHKRAVVSHREYAKTFLSKADYDKFLKWESTLDFKH